MSVGGIPLSTIYLDKSDVGPGETVTGTLTDRSLDFSTIPTHLAAMFRVTLLAQGGSSAALVFLVPDVRFVGPSRIEFDIPPVGPVSASGNTVPPGVYTAQFAYGFWSATGTPLLRVRTNPARSPSASRPPGPVTVPGAALFTAMRRLASSVFSLIRYYYRSLVLSFPIQLLFGRIPLRVLGQAQLAARYMDRFFQAVNSPAPVGGDSSVRPLIDAEENWPVIESMINDAEKFIFIVSLGVDERTNLKNTDQHDRPGRPESEWLDLERALKKRIEQTASHPLEIRVLAWETTFFADPNEYEEHFTDIGDLGIVTKNWGNVKSNSFQGFLRNIRPYSAASDDLLRVFYRGYRNAADHEDLPFPSGIEVAIEDHPTRSVLGSHHQKFILTEKSAWVGGLNLLKQQWDMQTHLHPDARRDHSGEGPYHPDPDEVPPWHDTGALIKGFAPRKVFPTFAERWDKAVMTRGPYEPLAQEISHRFSTIEAHLRSPAVARASRFGGRIRAFNSTIDGPYIVDSSNVAVSLPKGTAWAARSGVTHIKEHYERSLDVMAKQNAQAPGPFVYIENQYFTDVGFTKKLFDRWRRNVDTPGPGGRRIDPDEPFAFIVIPYKPQPTRDWTTGGGLHSIIYAEMQNLKWLEIRTARVIYTRDDNDDQWVPYCAVDFPQDRIQFLAAVARDPSQLDESSEFTIVNPIALNPDESRQRDANGNFVYVDPNPPLRVDEVMTRSDIMTYTLVSPAERRPDGTARDVTPSIVSGEDVEDRAHEYTLPRHIYTHSKAATFFNREKNIYVGTIGSANINPRSLDDQTHHQDSEMNIWWSRKEHVEAFRKKLWAHHLQVADPDLADEPAWIDAGWRNLVDIMHARNTRLNGTVVRLDVVDRYDQI